MPKTEGYTVAYERLSRQELSADELNDLELARQARMGAIAEQSHFLVGAALRTRDDEVAIGHNVENVVYAALHAEDGAMGNISKKSKKAGLKRVTVVGGPEGGDDYEEPVLPCGICRQKLLEFVPDDEEDPTMVIAAGVRGDVIRVALEDLLPLAFYPAVLRRAGKA